MNRVLGGVLALSLTLLASGCHGTRGSSEPLRLTVIGEPVVEPFGDSSVSAIALVFIAPECPIANAYHPQLTKLAHEYTPRGVRFYLVHSTLGLSGAEIEAHAESYDLSIPVVADSDQSLARAVGATVSPEAVVLRRGESDPVYRGAIDNLFADYGKKRAQVTEPWLASALDAVLSGRNPAPRSTRAVGCFIEFTE